MRLTVLAFAILPMTAFAQEATLPAPTEPVAQSQTCAVGTAWDAGLQTCVAVNGTASPLKGLSGHSGCNYGAAREVTS